MRFEGGEFFGGGERGTEGGEVEVDEVGFCGYRWVFRGKAFKSGVEEVLVSAEDVDFGVLFQERFLGTPSANRIFEGGKEKTYDGPIPDPTVSACHSHNFPAHVRDIFRCPLRRGGECFSEYLEVHCGVWG